MPASGDAGDEKSNNALINFLTYYNSKTYHFDVSDVAEIMAAFPKVNFRHYIAPSQSLGTLSIMDGTNKTCTWPMQ